MKGLETMPIKFVAISIILLIIVSIGFWQVSVFTQFRMQKNFKEDIVGVAQKIDFLRSGGDYMSVVQSEVSVPKGYEFIVDIDEDKLIGNLSGELYEVNLSVNITKVRLDEDGVSKNGSIIFSSGINRISLYYGNLKDSEVKKYTIVFEEK